MRNVRCDYEMGNQKFVFLLFRFLLLIAHLAFLFTLPGSLHRQNDLCICLNPSIWPSNSMVACLASEPFFTHRLVSPGWDPKGRRLDPVAPSPAMNLNQSLRTRDLESKLWIPKFGYLRSLHLSSLLSTPVQGRWSWSKQTERRMSVARLTSECE